MRSLNELMAYAKSHEERVNLTRELKELRAALVELKEQRRWRRWDEEPPAPGQDCLVMEGGGQAHRTNMPELGPGEYDVWWRPFGDEPDEIT